ncbi:ricin-type beta-trefoil lectin domain protein [Streptomyces chartreusis]|uniref:RICIN domain-containing protein n=1 Tax=Streptomyces chartreusis TaxID=1969 RepID=UPI0034089FDB
MLETVLVSGTAKGGEADAGEAVGHPGCGRRPGDEPEQRAGERNAGDDVVRELHRGLLCLDYNADWGVWTFRCNGGDYQKWHWNDDYEYTALRQVATKLCLTLRNGQVAMKPCAAADQAAQWQITDYAAPGGRTIQNSVNHQCLARMTNNLVNTAPCTGGPSQRWQAQPWLFTGIG